MSRRLHHVSLGVVDIERAAALRAGGIDHGPPGLGEHDGPDDHAAFVVDLEGHGLEAVCKGGD